jgi:hypothetical protein
MTGEPRLFHLLSARKGTSLAAREQIVDGLASLGPAARDALPQLDRLAKAAPAEPAAPEPPEQKALREREGRLAAAAQAASARIRASNP